MRVEQIQVYVEPFLETFEELYGVIAVHSQVVEEAIFSPELRGEKPAFFGNQPDDVIG
jgi:hypothetical protein